MSEESKKEAVKAENAGAKETGHETQTGAKPKKSGSGCGFSAGRSA